MAVRKVCRGCLKYVQRLGVGVQRKSEGCGDNGWGGCL